MGRQKKPPRKVLTPDKKKLASCEKALELIEDKEVMNPAHADPGEYFYITLPGASIEEAAKQTGLEFEEVYSLFIYQNAQKLKNEIMFRQWEADRLKPRPEHPKKRDVDFDDLHKRGWWSED